MMLNSVFQVLNENFHNNIHEQKNGQKSINKKQFYTVLLRHFILLFNEMLNL